MILDDRTEEQKCDDLVTQLRGTMRVFSAPEKSQFPGTPDRRYYVKRTALWAEIKSPTDRLSQKQIDFLRAEYDCDEVVFAGGRDALQRMLLGTPSEWRRVGFEELGIVVSRGMRKARAA